KSIQNFARNTPCSPAWDSGGPSPEPANFSAAPPAPSAAPAPDFAAPAGAATAAAPYPADGTAAPAQQSTAAYSRRTHLRARHSHSWLLWGYTGCVDWLRR